MSTFDFRLETRTEPDRSGDLSVDRDTLVRIRIGYLVPEFPSQTHAFFWRELTGLRECGAEVLTVSTRRPAGDCQHAFASEAAGSTYYLWPPSWSWELIAHLGRPANWFRALKYVQAAQDTPWYARWRILRFLVPALRLVLWSQMKRIQHIHVNSCANAAHIAALARELGGPSYSLALHGDLPVYGVDHSAKMRGAAFVSTVTGNLQNQIVGQVGLDRESVQLIWMGVDTVRFHPVERSCGSTNGNSLRIATIARLAPGKGHEIVLRALAKCVKRGFDLSYVIGGSGPHEARIRQLAEDLDVADRVELLGTLSEDQVCTVLQTSDIFILASSAIGEAAPVSVMEAMSCARPVICTIIGGTPRMITDGIDGYLVPQHDEASIVDRLILLTKDAKLRARIGAAARQRALKDFDYRSRAEMLYERILRTLRRDLG